ncbi:hypothetical protein Pelo_16911 [Pelomyxa schiedti]|nr:hypothetical protein Pelo_16911 [Pelomyxa schiedti]
MFDISSACILANWWFGAEGNTIRSTGLFWAAFESFGKPAAHFCSSEGQDTFLKLLSVAFDLALSIVAVETWG